MYKFFLTFKECKISTKDNTQNMLATENTNTYAYIQFILDLFTESIMYENLIHLKTGLMCSMPKLELAYG